jgi:hypothetical protein
MRDSLKKKKKNATRCKAKSTATDPDDSDSSWLAYATAPSWYEPHPSPFQGKKEINVNAAEQWLLKVAFLGYFSNLRQHFTQRARKVYFAVCVYTGVTYIIVMGFQIGYCQPVSLNWYVSPIEIFVQMQKINTLKGA